MTRSSSLHANTILPLKSSQTPAIVCYRPIFAMARSLLAALLMVSAAILKTTALTNPVSQSLPKLISAAVSDAINVVQLAAGTCSGIPKRVPDLDVYHRRAVDDCAELLQDTSDQLRTALSELSPESAGKHFHHLHTLLTAAYANHYTCLDGLSLNDTKKVRAILAKDLETSAGMLSKSLALLKQIKPTVNQEEGFPSWVSKYKDRKLLEGPGADDGEVAADVVVAADGSGDYVTIGEAVAAAPNKSEERFVIYVKEGVYEENVEIGSKKWNLTLVGDGVGKTVVTGDRNVVDGWTTYRSATFAVSGEGFMARDITFQNTAGASKHQAVALRVNSDLSAFHRCNFDGYQDTLYTHSQRQFYRSCTISGTVDFIFGDAAAVFQDCTIAAKLPNPGQSNVFTAQGRKDPNQNSGISIQRCNLTGTPDLAAAKASVSTYLGRPWKNYSRTVVMESYLGDMITPAGWLEWDGDFALQTLYYGEYDNTGPGAGTAERVKWPGYRVINSSEEANQFTADSFIQANEWVSSTAVPYLGGLH